MARGDPNDLNRDGVNDEFDGKPGNRSDSPSYARIFDPRSEQEFSNLLEPANETQARVLVERLRARQSAEQQRLIEAQKAVHFWPSVGKFIVPEENTWIAHHTLVSDNRNALHFNPPKYPYFDKIIADKLKLPGLYDPSHADYAKYEPLRTNLEVLRNDLIGNYLRDGSFDPGDEKYVPNLIHIAGALGDALNNDRSFLRVFTPSLSVEVANQEAVGAAEMYRYLLSQQQKPGMVAAFFAKIKEWVGGRNTNWGLPPIEETPFSPEGLSAPPPLKPDTVRGAARSTDLVSSVASPEQVIEMSTRAESMLALAPKLLRVSELNAEPKQLSVDEARNILRLLRNLGGHEKNAFDWVEQSTPDGQALKVETVEKLLHLYAAQLKHTAATAPERLSDPSIVAANEAALGLVFAAGEHSFLSLPDGAPNLLKLDMSLELMPSFAAQAANKPTGELVDALERGLSHLSGKYISEKSAPERLVAAGNRVHASAKRLSSVSTLKPPARAESVEVAREILRKLQELDFARSSAESLISGMNAQAKADAAEKMVDVVERYEQLLSQAATTNPSLLKDNAVQEASTAAGHMAHTVKLMAAKELPNSVAAAQQISADIAQMPEQWKSLDGRTIGRIMQSMEGGLEKAVNEIETQEQQGLDQQEELSREMAEAALLQNDQSRRRRRRRRQSKVAGGGSKAANRRNAGDLNGDGVSDRVQGINLGGNDAIDVRALGASLRDMSNQAASLTPPPEAAPNPLAPTQEQGFSNKEKAPRTSGKRERSGK